MTTRQNYRHTMHEHPRSSRATTIDLQVLYKRHDNPSAPSWQFVALWANDPTFIQKFYRAYHCWRLNRRLARIH